MQDDMTILRFPGSKNTPQEWTLLELAEAIDRNDKYASLYPRAAAFLLGLGYPIGSVAVRLMSSILYGYTADQTAAEWEEYFSIWPGGMGPRGLGSSWGDTT